MKTFFAGYFYYDSMKKKAWINILLRKLGVLLRIVVSP